jgi:UPF0755 protein
MSKPRLIISLIVAAIIVAGLIMGWCWWAPVGAGDQQNFTVRSGETISSIAKHLKDSDLIRSVWGFKFYLKLTGKVIVQPGVYQLQPNYWLPKVANTIASGSTANVMVTIPEGYTLQQIVDLLADKQVTDPEQFVVASKTLSLDYEFLKDKPTDASMEGFLFPDTYRLIKGDATEAVKAMLDNFGAKYKSEMEPSLGERSLYKIVTIASLIEKEAKTQADREQIAAVIYNRLDANMRLDIDATVRYAINDWKKALTKEDLSVDSPYNTRRVSGLPPTPICNPGLASIKAALNPPKSDYYYYLTDYQGVTHCAKTLAEHNANKLKYL